MQQLKDLSSHHPAWELYKPQTSSGNPPLLYHITACPSPPEYLRLVWNFLSLKMSATFNGSALTGLNLVTITEVKD